MVRAAGGCLEWLRHSKMAGGGLAMQCIRMSMSLGVAKLLTVVVTLSASRTPVLAACFPFTARHLIQGTTASPSFLPC